MKEEASNMFTGIIETQGEVISVENELANVHFEIKCTLANELKIDQSIAHDGVCLTIVGKTETSYTVTAIEETLNKTNLAHWKIGDKINIERCMPANGRFDGHIVQGHIDLIATCVGLEDRNGSWWITFQYEDDNHITVEKGSITVNGISLTVINSMQKTFTVAIIPYTYEHTNLKNLKIGNYVNLEFDILGKYIKKLLSK